MKKQIKIIITLFLISCKIYGQTYTWDFEQSYDGWTAGFSDYSDSNSVNMGLFDSLTLIPYASSSLNNKGIAIGGDNTSDDLFIFLKKKITGLLPNSTYKVTFNIGFATEMSSQIFIGECALIKVGGSSYEPLSDTIGHNGYYQMNIDKGNQQQDGPDMKKISCTHHDSSYSYNHYYRFDTNNINGPIVNITTNSQGEMWVIIGNEMSHEFYTKLFYDDITIEFLNVTGIDETKNNDFLIYPNPSADILNFSKKIYPLQITMLDGKQIAKTSGTNKIVDKLDISSLPNGAYILSYKSFSNSKAEEYRNAFFIKK